MAAPRKTVLVAGLGPTVSDTTRKTFDDFDPSKTLDLVAVEVEKAKASGYDCGVLIVEPWDASGTLTKLKARLERQHWDGLSIGYAVRAFKESSQLFEDMVNLAVQVSPETKFIFPLGREDIWEAIQRALEEV